MKKISFNIYIIMAGFLMIAASLPSCKKLIEIPNPPSAITQDEQFADSLTTLSAVTGVYAINSNGSGFAYSNVQFTFLPALSADELTYVPVNDYQQFYSYSLTPLNSGAANLWGAMYQSIYQVNKVLEGVNSSNGLSASFKRQITGEMEVLRSLYYFSMVNFYGDVPLITTSDYNITARTPRSPVAAVYKQITTDLADARKKLLTTYPSPGHIRPNLYTAIALQAKVNLYQGNWQGAFNEADSVIRFSSCSLVSAANISKVFLDGSTEAIWQLPGAQAFSNGVPDAVAFVPTSATTFPNYIITPFLLSAFEAGDQRLANWTASRVRLVSGVNQTQYYPFKYKNRLSTVTPAEDQMVLRLAEMYLIRAEAAAHLGGASNLNLAVNDINIIRLRAGLLVSTVDATSQTAVLNAVMKERQTELFCEWANRWYDLKRTGTAAAVLNSEKSGYTANAALYPVPQAQILLNNLLLPNNPGYN